MTDSLPSAPTQPRAALKLFMSGTQEDMVEERNAVDAAIRRLHHNPVRAETMGSQARPSREAILKAVRDCDVYIGVFGGRYGWIVPDLDISATQLEYEEAFLRKPTLIYVKDASNVEDRQKDFLKRAQDFDGGFFRRPPFKTAEELASWIEADVTALVSERFTQPDLAPRRQLAYAYAREVQLRFEEWRSRYATLTARSETVAVPEPGLGTPREFRPPGSRSTYNLEDRAGPGFIIGSAKYPGVIAAVNAAGGDAVLLGEPGAGKTTSLWRLMLEYADLAARDPAAPLPVLIPLGGYDGQRSVLELVQHYLILDAGQKGAPLRGHLLLSECIREELQRRRLVLLFDGLNEIPRNFQSAAVWKLQEFKSAWTGNRFLFTCRASDYASKIAAVEIRVDPLSDRGIDEFITASLGGRSRDLISLLRRQDRTFWEICRNPYMLALIVTIFGDRRGSLPTNRSFLFGEFVSALLRRERFAHADRWIPAGRLSHQASGRELLQMLEAWWPPLVDRYDLGRLSESQKTEFTLVAGSIVASLGELAYRMSTGGQTGTTASLEFITTCLSRPKRFRGAVALDAEWAVGLAADLSLLERKADRAGFTHQLLQEYFAATYLASLPPGDPVVAGCFSSRRWDETLLLLAGLAPNYDAFIAELVPHRLILAARCAGVRPEQLGRNAVEMVVAHLAYHANDVYSPWRNDAIFALGASRLPAALPILEPIARYAGAYLPVVWGAIGSIGSQEAADFIIESLQNPVGLVRKDAAHVAGRFRIRAAIPAILGRLRQDDSYVRQVTNPVLLELWTADNRDELIGLLNDASWQVQWAAIRGLGWIGAREAVPRLVEFLSDSREEVRIAAAESLRYLGPDARVALPRLIEQIERPAANFRHAASAVEAIGELAVAEDIPRLLEWLRDTNPMKRLAAVDAVGRLKVAEAIPGLFDCLRKGTGSDQAGRTLARLGGVEVISGLLVLLREGNSDVRSRGRRVLVELNARESIPILVDALRHAGQEEAAEISGTLANLWTSDDTSDILRLLQDENWDVRSVAIAAASCSSRPIQEAIPLLIERLKGSRISSEEQSQVASALANLGAAEAVPWISERVTNSGLPRWPIEKLVAGNIELAESVLRDANPELRNAAIEGLGRSGNPNAIPILRPTLNNDDLRPRTVDALVKLGASEAIPRAVVEVISGHIRMGTVLPGVKHPLSAFKPAEILPELEVLLGHPDWWVRKRIAGAYDRVRLFAGEADRVSRDETGFRSALRKHAELAAGALELLPDSSAALFQTANALRRIGSPSDAFDLLSGNATGAAALELERACCLLDLREPEKAAPLLDLLGERKLSPAQTVLRIRLLEGCLHPEEIGRLYDEAVASLRFPRTWRARADWYIRHERYAEAEHDMAEAAEFEKEFFFADPLEDAIERWHPDMHRQAGKLALAMGRFAQAAAAFERAGTQEPRGAWRAGLAFACLGLSESEGARARILLDEALAHIELREQLHAALEDLMLLERAAPGLPELSATRARLEAMQL